MTLNHWLTVLAHDGGRDRLERAGERAGHHHAPIGGRRGWRPLPWAAYGCAGRFPGSGHGGRGVEARGTGLPALSMRPRLAARGPRPCPPATWTAARRQPRPVRVADGGPDPVPLNGGPPDNDAPFGDGGPDLVPLSDGLPDNDAPFGPLALLLVGFAADEAAAVRSMMDAMDASMVAVVRATEGMLAEPLSAALAGDGAADASLPLDPGTSPVPRALIVSGMYAGELEDTMAGYREAGLPQPLWCAALPSNWEDRPLGQLVLDIAGDAEAMAARAREGEGGAL